MEKIKKISSLVVWLVFSLLVMAVAIYLILLANGYKINYKTHSWQKTGLIYLKSQPNQVDLYLDSQLVSKETPYRIANLFPGRYEVKLAKEDYQDWQKTLWVEEGKTSAEEQILLFLQQPVSLLVEEEEKESLGKLVEQWPAKGLEIKNQTEIWFNDVYVTRFFQEIKQLSWYPDLKHILLQMDKKIWIMDADGTNIIKLVDLQSDQTSQFVLINSGKELFYKDGEEVKKVKIQ